MNKLKQVLKLARFFLLAGVLFPLFEVNLDSENLKCNHAQSLCYIKRLSLSHLSVFADEHTPVSLPDLLPKLDPIESEPWSPPDFSGQEGNALGYQVGTFAVPAGLLEKKVAFWLEIYTRLTTEEGLLHDSRYVDLVYEKIDFHDISNNDSLSRHEKQRMKEKRVKEKKAVIVNRLKRLQQLSSPAGLDGEDLRYWYMFASIGDKQKFLEAGKEGRLRFQLGQRDRFIEGIYLSGRYLPELERIFRDQGLPIELTRLPFVESSFNINARSRAGASGIWQFMPGTGRRFLKISSTFDERNEPFAATEAAARYFRKIYDYLGEWPLAITGYNRGPAGVKRMVELIGTSDINELVSERQGRFGFASANFYASFLAALEAEKNAEKYFGKIRRAQPLKFKEFKPTIRVSRSRLLKWFANEREKAELYNPHLNSKFWKHNWAIPDGTRILVPVERYDFILADIRNNKLEEELTSGRSYRVSKGETLSDIAERFKVGLSHLIELNEISRPDRLHVGQELKIP